MFAATVYIVFCLALPRKVLIYFLYLAVPHIDANAASQSGQ